MTANPIELTRTRIFDHVSVEISDPGPWALRTRKGNEWIDAVIDTFDGGANDRRDLHFRAGRLGPAGTDIPGGARWRVSVRSDDESEHREGFLVKTEHPVTGTLRMSAGSFRGPYMEVEFPDASGFFTNFCLPDTNVNLVNALRLRFDALIFGILRTGRTEKDFRWVAKSFQSGKSCALRRSEASVRALIRYVDPHEQKLLICDNLLLQDIDLAVPSIVMSLGSGISLRNGFEVSANTEILLPGSIALQPLTDIRSGAFYEWIVLANPSGVFLHWLELNGNAVSLNPRLYTQRGEAGAVIGYRVDNIDKTWHEATGGKEMISLGQRVAVLGGADWYEMVKSPVFVASLAKSLNRPPSRWAVRLEQLP